MLPDTLVGCSSKSYFDLAGARAWARHVSAAVRRGDLPGEGLYVCPAFPLIPVLASELDGTGVDLGAQDVSAHPSGAFTGEVSASLLAELGVRYAMVGHPERLAIVADEPAAVPHKIARVAAAGLVPIVIVGEPDRHGDAAPLWRRQLEEGLRDFPPDGEVVIAYEPTWAIGREQPAPAAHVAEAVETIRRLVAPHCGTSRVLYGGSARRGTFTDIADAAAARPPGLPDGIFLGRGGLDPAQFIATALEVHEARRAVPRAG